MVMNQPFVIPTVSCQDVTVPARDNVAIILFPWISASDDLTLSETFLATPAQVKKPALWERGAEPHFDCSVCMWARLCLWLQQDGLKGTFTNLYTYSVS